MKLLLLTIFGLFAISNAFENSDIVSARIETCRGCSLNRLPEVKRFVMDDAPKYERLEVKFISGAPPELVLLGEGDRELERLPLSQLSREECNKLVESRGFTQKSKDKEL
ncbi:selenoprotein M-like [Trichoplusia ni]|uniref:Selenoprotein M n=1 Tax=Trichoplusia ni TaxID=7111 RepID=A0A7E5WPJ3_TRINI|nr:selenoprotein M-like [Trichoplusia ni]